MHVCVGDICKCSTSRINTCSACAVK
jgi:hypothetical protein